MRKLCHFAVIALLLGNSDALGDVSDSPLSNLPAPKPPFVARAPEQSAWLIVITPNEESSTASSSNPSHPPKTLKAQLWTKSGSAMQCANEWSDGTRTEDTVVGQTKIAQSPDGNGVHLYNPRLDPRYHDFSTGDFEMLDWITPENYVGAFSHAGERSYLFRTKGIASNAQDAASASHNLSMAEINAPTSPTSVYISIRTGLPVEIDNAKGKYLFQFGSPGELRLPEDQPSAAAPPSPPPNPSPSKPKAPANKTSSASPPLSAPKAVKKKSSDSDTGPQSE